MFDVGRKLSVGDCALFQAGNAPPFIGILRNVIHDKDAKKFVVNWLYRPADVKLAKGGPLEAAPTEIFYSFHKDEISAASLLHPCKVAFLRKGIELPPGVSHFVCRRVYDTANRCLWWLTDRDYTDEHQDEVDTLLERTKLEMQATVQSEGPSPRALIGGPTSSQQLKAPGSEAVQNATYAAPNKSKKRDRTDQSLEPSKRERSVKAEDGELSPLKRDRSMKPEEIASITDKDGGLINAASVERLVQLMQQERNDGSRKSTDVASRRLLLAGVVAATEREDCLSLFVQLGGLPMLDDWLQEAHKGKGGEGGSPKEGDKGVEELLLTLLKALDKLPVDLDALKTCCVGKSVNHLRSHRNLEIQKKARKLVDIWKKRVDAEMKLNGEAKPGSNQQIWNYKQQNTPEVLHSHVIKPGVPTEVAVKSSGAFAGSAKPMANGTSSSDGIAKAGSPSVGKISSILASASPSTMKREENDNNNSSSKVFSNTLSADVKEEKSGNSSLQPQSNGQAWGNGSQVRGSAGGSSWKEDVKSATMGGTVSSKSSGSSSRMPAKGLLGANLAASSKDLLGGKPLVWSRTAVSDKLASPSPGQLDKGPSDAGHETSREHRLIVRIPNPGRSPARQSAYDHGTPGSRGLSPNMSGRSSSLANVDASDGKGRVSNGNLTAPSSDANGDAKSGALASRGGRAVPGDDERDKFSTPVHSDVTAEGEKRAGESTRAEPDRPAKESMEQNGLVRGGTERNGVLEGTTGAEEGKKAETGAGEPIAAAADGVPAEATSMEVAELGISLLASVAASEIRTGAGESAIARGQQEDKNLEPNRPSRVLCEAAGPRSKDGSSAQPDVGEGGVVKEQNESRNLQEAVAGATKSGREEVVAEQGNDGNVGKLGGSGATEKVGQEPCLSPMRDCDAHDSPKQLLDAQDAAARLSETSNGSIAVKSSAERTGQDRHTEENGAEPITLPAGSSVPFSKGMKSSAAPSPTESPIVSPEVGGLNANKSAKKDSSDEKKGQVQGKAVELSNGYTSTLGADLKALQPLTSGDIASVRLDRGSAVNSAGLGEAESDSSRSVRDAGDRKGSPLSATEAVFDGAQELKRAMDRRTLGRVPSSQVMGLPGLTPSSISAAVTSQQHVKPAAAAVPHTLPAGEPATPEQATETAGPSEGVVNGSDVSERPDFDLNEGFAVEESPQDESTTSPPVPPAPMPPMASAPAPSASVATPVAIVTATKGAFVLPASPMRTKSELGWKGSAATSAFRPAEPRRTPDRQPSTAECSAPAAPEIVIGCGPSAVKTVRPSLDLNIDLNVDDERNFEDGLGVPVATAPALGAQGPGFGGVVTPSPVTMHSISAPAAGKINGEYASQGHHHHQRLPPHAGNSAARPVLDLNLLDDGEESGTLSATDAGFLYPPTLVASAANVVNSSSSSITRRESVVHDFDLNNGPSGDEGLADDQPVVQPSISRNAVPPPPMMPTVPGLRRVPEAVNPSGFAPGISLKPAAMPDFSSTSRAESSYSVAAAVAAQSYLSAGAGGPPQHFNPAELYRGNVPPPSMPPTPPFPPAAQVSYPYGGFPSGSAVYPFTSGAAFNPNNVAPYIVSTAPVNFPITSAGAVAAQHFTRPPPPYLIGMSDVGVVSDNANGGWSARPSLDLNAGPEPVDGDGPREDVMSAARSSSAMAGHTHFDQMRALRHVAGGASVFGPVPPLKRKEPENGWDMSRNGGFKQQTWR